MAMIHFRNDGLQTIADPQTWSFRSSDLDLKCMHCCIVARLKRLSPVKIAIVDKQLKAHNYGT